jgi:hypothetical protein
VTHMLDIFRLESCGVLWLGSAASLEFAKARVQELAARSPGEYLVIKLGSMEERADNRRTEVGTHE